MKVAWGGDFVKKFPLEYYMDMDLGLFFDRNVKTLPGFIETGKLPERI